MSRFAYDGQRRRADGRFGRSLRSLAGDVGRKVTTPLGTTCLAVFSLAAGLHLGSSVGVPGTEIDRLRGRVQEQAAHIDELRGQLALEEIQGDRLRHIQGFSSRYGVPADLAASIYDIALAEDVDPALAFRLVRIESSFRQHAVSQAGAVGYTQVKPSTARLLDPSVRYDQLFETETNLRLGFRYLRLLLHRYEGDVKLALLAYNRGPTRVGSLLALGRDPSNGYAERVLGELE